MTLSEIIERIKKYEQISYFENYEYSLSVNDLKFKFRDKFDGSVVSIEYPSIDGNYDNLQITRAGLNDLILCISEAEDKGFEI